MQEFDLEADIGNSDILAKVYDNDYAKELYSALCNMNWCKIDVITILTEDYYSVTWREAGSIVADFRSAWYDEDYTDWYCSGNEGIVSDRIKADLAELGWAPIPYE